MTVAIVSTQRTWNKESEPWAHYHLSRGFSKIYVFVDWGRIDFQPSSSAVQLIACTQEYWAAHTSRHWPKYVEDVRRDYGTSLFGSPASVMQRQTLNANVAMELAVADGIDWLLHIDDDEYFWCPDMPVEAHFDGLQRAGIETAVYLNHEAALLGPDTPPDKRRRTWFKKNPNSMKSNAWGNVPNLGNKPYFVCYANGKSAGRVLPDKVVSNGCHTFWVHNSMGATAEFGRPGVLHRAFKDVSQFCRRYLEQGIYPTEVPPGHPCSNLPLAQKMARQLIGEGNTAGLQALFEEMGIHPEAERAMMEEQGFLMALDEPLPFETEEEALVDDTKPARMLEQPRQLHPESAA